MATATVATAAGAAALLYYTLKWKLHVGKLRESGEGDASEDVTRPILPATNPASRRPAQAPATWLETISTLSETLRFTYSETLGKWPIGDLAFGINFLLRRQGLLPVATIFAGEECTQLKGAEIVAELKYLLNLLNLCWHFSKKPFPLFLEATGYSQEDVILQKPKAGILKPAFTVLIDKNTKSILLLVRGTHSIRDTLTAVTGAIVPFHHTLVTGGGISDLVLGYAHCGMVAAARWIAKLATPRLLEALQRYPDYSLKIVGHSLGGGTAALLTYILREQQEFATTTCVTFAPAACMTWELAESGIHFVTSIINGADLVPSFSPASVDDLRSEVTASAWLNDLRNQIERTRIVSTVYRSASALGSKLPSIASTRARVADAGAILRPVSSGTQGVVRRAKDAAQAALGGQTLLSSLSCIGTRRRSKSSSPSTRLEEKDAQHSTSTTDASGTLTNLTEATAAVTKQIVTSQVVGCTSDPACTPSSEISHADAIEHNIDNSGSEDVDGQQRAEESMTEFELWEQLENELYLPKENEEAEVENEITEESDAATTSATPVAREDDGPSEVTPTEPKELRRFYPPGKVMHIVTFSEETSNQEDASTSHSDENTQPEKKIAIFLTPRLLYGKLRLSQAMINDHYMPIYRRNMEQVISTLEKETCKDSSSEQGNL